MQNFEDKKKQEEERISREIKLVEEELQSLANYRLLLKYAKSEEEMVHLKNQFYEMPVSEAQAYYESSLTNMKGLVH